ncbi:MAG: hypothetical protein Q9164_007099, partial [Protoblastenia rupestris]
DRSDDDSDISISKINPEDKDDIEKAKKALLARVRTQNVNQAKAKMEFEGQNDKDWSALTAFDDYLKNKKPKPLAWLKELVKEYNNDEKLKGVLDKIPSKSGRVHAALSQFHEKQGQKCILTNQDQHTPYSNCLDIGQSEAVNLYWAIRLELAIAKKEYNINFEACLAFSTGAQDVAQLLGMNFFEIADPGNIGWKMRSIWLSVAGLKRKSAVSWLKSMDSRQKRNTRSFGRFTTKVGFTRRHIDPFHSVHLMTIE